MTELIITEKPNAAKKIAEALAEGKAKKESKDKVSYYTFQRHGKPIIVASAVGHLYGLAEKEKKGWTFPVFDIEWVPTSEISKDAAYAKKYLTTLRQLGKGVKEFTVATDYDIEGEVIGLNVIRHLFHQKDAGRMKFSTLTPQDLVKAYEHKSKHLDWGQANAGETRHKLDWFYGINTSRALTSAIKKGGGMFKILSAGRVQGPALKIVVDREKEIKAFVPEPYWQIQLLANAKNQDFEAWHSADRFQVKEQAESAFAKVKGAKDARVSAVERRQFEQSPPNPFDLTTLQTEAYRTLKINPKETLAIAQELYVGGFISYPRTSSQQLPKELGLPAIVKQLGHQMEYKELVAKLLKESKLEPNDGKKTDPAHPAIFPTGIAPKALKPRFQKIYDLVVRRFLATLATSSLRETMTVTLDIREELFIAKGTRTVKQGWQEYYGPYVGAEEETLPAVVENDKVKVNDIILHEKETQPPKRYTPASIIRELERLNLGTKATRAQIIDTLYNRGYIDGQSITATDLGMQTLEILEKYCPEMTDVELTKQFEESMEGISEQKTTPDEVLEKAKVVITKIIQKFKGKEKNIGAELGEANKAFIKETTTLGQCPICKQGELTIRKGKFGRFAACNRYPDCKTTISLPAGALVKVSDKVCESCHYPMALIIRKRRPQEICINKDCASKKMSKEEKKEASQFEGKPCEACKEGTMVLRKSVYGSFLGCSRYPKCRKTIPLANGPNKDQAKEKKEES